MKKVNLKLTRDLKLFFSCPLEEGGRWTSELLLPDVFRLAAEDEGAAERDAAAAGCSRKARSSSLLDVEELEERSSLEGTRRRRNQPREEEEGEPAAGGGGEGAAAGDASCNCSSEDGGIADVDL